LTDESDNLEPLLDMVLLKVHSAKADAAAPLRMHLQSGVR